MTAEIAILNTSAVALAADSAMTVGNERKTYHSRKLFMLSDANPVGIMLFNNASLLGLPWETIIKQYRKHHGGETLDRLHQYAEHFISYLESNSSDFFLIAAQDSRAIRDVLKGFMFIREEIDDAIKERTRKAKINENQIQRIVRGFADATLETLEKIERPRTYPPDHARRVYLRYVSAIEVLIDEIFKPLPIDKVIRKKLRRVGLLSLLAPWLSDYTGLVIAGFGEKDMFPAVIAHKVYAPVLGKLRYSTMTSNQVNPTPGNRAFIYAFAQADVASGFMDGISPTFEKEISQSLFGELFRLEKTIQKLFPKPSRQQKQALAREIDELVKRYVEKHLKSAAHSHSRPVIEAVAVLPKEELASMAETLVSLTSFKRRITLDVETVGGPVDVAVISKGDGFTWIKRKHYFGPELNPHFFKRYN